MPWITVAIPPFGSIEQFDRVMTKWRKNPPASKPATSEPPPTAVSASSPCGSRRPTPTDVARSYVRQPVT